MPLRTSRDVPRAISMRCSIRDRAANLPVIPDRPAARQALLRSVSAVTAAPAEPAVKASPVKAAMQGVVARAPV